MSEAILHYTNEFRARRDVSPYDAEFLFDAMIGSEDEDSLVGLLTAWAAKGTTEDELYRFASILRSRMKRVDARDLACVDIVGTGGSTAKTFNVSTAAAFVVAGAGIPVSKHGNRAATSLSGSSDVLMALGIDVDIEPNAAEDNLHRHGICFMFAPRHHSLSPTLGAARRRVGSPTIFNCIGPLSNPASAPHQLIGVWNARLVDPMSRVLFRLGTKLSLIVNHEGQLDELSTSGVSNAVSVSDEGLDRITVDAGAIGLGTDDELPQKLNATASAKLIEEILASKHRDSPAEKIVVLNSAAAISLPTGKPLEECVEDARSSIRTGSALAKLKALRKRK